MFDSFRRSDQDCASCVARIGEICCQGSTRPTRCCRADVPRAVDTTFRVQRLAR